MRSFGVIGGVAFLKTIFQENMTLSLGILKLNKCVSMSTMFEFRIPIL